MRKSNLIQARTALPKGHSKEENLVLGKSETLRRSARIQAKGIAFESARTDKPDCSKRSVVQEVQCLTCDKTFGNKKDLRSHVQKVHKKRELHKCESCNKAFSRKEHLRRHNCPIGANSHENKHECDKCHKKFGRRDNMIRHIKQVHENEEFICLWCQARYSRWEKMYAHMEENHFLPLDSSHTNDANDDISTSPVSDCDTHRECENDANHSSSDSDDPRPSTSSMVRRKIKKKNVEYKGELPPHKWDNKCPECGKEFSVRSARDQHVKEIHSDANKVMCPACDKTFSNWRNMNRHHDKAHSVEPLSYKCDTCDQSFSRPVHLLAHQKQAHNWDDQCPICDKKFMWKNDKHRHMSEVHSKAGRVKCPDCGKDFSRRENMLVHQKQSHSDNAQSFKCDECPAEFTRKFYLKKHKQKGKHYIELLCKYCDQIITFKSHAGKERHFLGGWKTLHTCKNAKKRLLLGRIPSEEEKQAFIEAQLERDCEENVRLRAYGTYRKEYAKCSYEDYVNKLLKEDKERRQKYKERQIWEEENEYDCPKELLDPLTVGLGEFTKVMHDPITNRICGHTFERSTLAEWFKAKKYRWPDRKYWYCPHKDSKNAETHCINKRFLESDMEDNIKIKAEIDRRKERKRRQKAGNLTEHDKEEMEIERQERMKVQNEEFIRLWKKRVAKWNVSEEIKKSVLRNNIGPLMRDLEACS